MNGTVARALPEKGFGFIKDDSGQEYFFHRSAVIGTTFELLREGNKVTFEIEPSTKGPRAKDVRPA